VKNKRQYGIKERKAGRESVSAQQRHTTGEVDGRHPRPERTRGDAAAAEERTMDRYSLNDSGNTYGGMRIIAFVNEKGGVAKTTSCINLAACFAARGHRVLVMDMDPQANATLGLGVDPSCLDPHASLLLTDNRFPLERAIRHTEVPRLDLAPSDSSLGGCNKTLVTEVGREVRLRGKMLDYARSVFTE
jgi:Mrp family chromosome partitioning ATPase